MMGRRRVAAVAEAGAPHGAAAPRRRRPPLSQKADRRAPGDAPPPPSEKTTTGRPCPICGKPPSAAYVPFCSKRCADVDLHKWLGGVYAIPAEEPTNPDDLPPSEEKD